MTEEFQRVEEERRRLNLPDRREHTYEKLQAHLDEHLDRIEGYVHKWIRRGLIACGIIAAFCILGLVGFGVVLSQVQNQRHEVCVNQNKRHDNTIALFTKLAADTIKKHPEQAKDIRESTGANISIINALAPKQDCDKIAPERNLFP